MGTITDGGSVMMKFGRNTSPLHIACMVHTIHLCICDVLYKKPIDDELIENDDILRVI